MVPFQVTCEFSGYNHDYLTGTFSSDLGVIIICPGILTWLLRRTIRRGNGYLNRPYQIHLPPWIEDIYVYLYMWKLPIDPFTTAFSLGRNEWLILRRSLLCKVREVQQKHVQAAREVGSDGRDGSNELEQPSLKLTARPWKTVVGRWSVLLDGLFSEAMLVSGSASSGWKNTRFF